MLLPVPRSKIVGKAERTKKCEKPREGWGERASRRFSLARFFSACALFSLYVRFFRSTEREPSTSYDPDDPFSGESRIPNFIHHFPEHYFLFQSTSAPKGWYKILLPGFQSEAVPYQRFSESCSVFWSNPGSMEYPSELYLKRSTHHESLIRG